MANSTTFPFLQSEDDRIHMSAWQINPDGRDSKPLNQDHIENWDYLMDLHLVREITINAANLRDDCKLSNKDQIAIAPSWKCTGTDIINAGDQHKISNQSEQTVKLTLNIPGEFLSESVLLFVKIFLVESGGERHPLAAKLPGSVLWETSKMVNVEGSGERFPVIPLNFKSSPFPDMAPWYLDWNRHNLEGDIRGRGFRLFINTKREEIFEAITVKMDNEISRLIKSMLIYDTAKKLIEGCVNSDMLSDKNLTDFPRNSIGGMVMNLINTYFPNRTPQEISKLQDDKPEEFDAMIQHKLEFMDLE